MFCFIMNMKYYFEICIVLIMMYCADRQSQFLLVFCMYLMLLGDTTTLVKKTTLDRKQISLLLLPHFWYYLSYKAVSLLNLKQTSVSVDLVSFRNCSFVYSVIITFVDGGLTCVLLTHGEFFASLISRGFAAKHTYNSML